MLAEYYIYTKNHHLVTGCHQYPDTQLQLWEAPVSADGLQALDTMPSLIY